MKKNLPTLTATLVEFMKNMVRGETELKNKIQMTEQASTKNP